MGARRRRTSGRSKLADIGAVRYALLVLVLYAGGALAADGAASQPPAPSTAKASGPQEANAANTRSEIEKLKSEAGQPVTVNVFSPQATQSTTSNKTEQSHEESSWKGVWEALIAIGTVALAFITGLLAWYTYKLWQEAVKGREKAIEDGLASQIATQEALIAAKESANAAKETVETMERNSRKELRAYLTVKNAFASWHPDKDQPSRLVEVVVNIINGGNTPARKVKLWACMATLSEAEAAASKFERDCKTLDPVNSVAVHGPRQVNSIRITQKFDRLEDILCTWKSGVEALYVFGEITYEDAFAEEPRSTTFRLVMPPTGIWRKRGGFMSCAEGNDYT